MSMSNDKKIKVPKSFFEKFTSLVKEYKEFNVTAPEKKFGSAQTKDGTNLQWDGEALSKGIAIMVIDPNNGAIPAPDGEIELVDGTKIKIEGGLVTEIMPVSPEVPQTPGAPAAPETQSQAQPFSYEDCVKEAMTKYNDQAMAEKVCAPMKAGQVGMREHIDLVSKLIDAEIALNKYKTESENSFNAFKKQTEAQIATTSNQLKKALEMFNEFLEITPDEVEQKPERGTTRKEKLLEKFNTKK